jgi:aldehyde:ferredoxin oxidoreductase
MYAYAGKFLRIDLSEKVVKRVSMKEEDCRLYIGGSGIAAKIHYQVRSYEAEPLSDKNPLVIFTGPLAGTKAPSTSRIEFCARSPLTRGWGESNAGGKLANYLKYAGWDGMVIEGASEKPVFVHINENGAEILDASSMWGSTTYDAQEAMEADLKEKRLSTAVIGPAGENLVKYASIMVDNSRFAGRTGMGAVMGIKKLKGIAVSFDPENRFVPEIANPEKFEEELKGLYVRIKDNFTANMFKELGTAGYVESAEMFGDLPVKYFTQGIFDGASKISGSAMAESILIANDGCLGCPIQCGRVVELQGKVMHGPEYETLASFGSLQLNESLEELVRINQLANSLGLDTISAGVTIAFAMYLTEKGVKDFGVEWGDGEAVMELLKDIAYRRGNGDLLAEGVAEIGRRLGVKGVAAHVRGLEIPMHDPRAFSSLAVAYAVNNRGACHLPHQMYNVEMGLKIKEYGIVSDDRFSDEGKGVITAKMQNFAELFNALIMCAFVPIKPAQMASLLSAATGFEFDAEKLYTTGERIYNLKRMYNVKAGRGKEFDKLPGIVLQPLEGGSEGNVPDVYKQLKEYYEFRGWKEGVPTEEKLKELGLEWVL